MSTQRDRILEFISRFPGRDDDQIAAALQIAPRQTVNMVCRQLTKEGRMTRRPGPMGKLVNFVVSQQSDEMNVHPRRPEAIVEADIEGELAPAAKRVPLELDTLVNGGFSYCGQWKVDAAGRLQLPEQVPRKRGVYAFVKQSRAMYVGIASMGLRRRLYLYVRPGPTQRTSQRLNGLLRTQIGEGGEIHIYTATPQDFEWNGLPVNGSAARDRTDRGI
jgi:hypothetical protein